MTRTISYKRIHIINSECSARSNGAEKAVLKFYVSDKDGSDKTDKGMTVKAYEILFDYVENTNMGILDAFFADKVSDYLFTPIVLLGSHAGIDSNIFKWLDLRCGLNGHVNCGPVSEQMR
jgi:hypothetical protein